MPPCTFPHCVSFYALYRLFIHRAWTGRYWLSYDTMDGCYWLHWVFLQVFCPPDHYISAWSIRASQPSCALRRGHLETAAHWGSGSLFSEGTSRGIGQGKRSLHLSPRRSFVLWFLNIISVIFTKSYFCLVRVIHQLMCYSLPYSHLSALRWYTQRDWLPSSCSCFPCHKYSIFMAFKKILFKHPDFSQNTVNSTSVFWLLLNDGSVPGSKYITTYQTFFYIKEEKFCLRRVHHKCW